MSYYHLSSEERYVISYLVLADLSLREIGRRTGRHHSTISREIKRNRPTYADDAVYWYDAAQQYADQKKRKAHHWRRKSNPQLVHYVHRKLIDDWSPEEIIDTNAPCVQHLFLRRKTQCNRATNQCVTIGYKNAHSTRGHLSLEALMSNRQVQTCPMTNATHN